MYRIKRTVEFSAWLDGLRDIRAQEKITTRLVRVQSGLLGDWNPVGDSVSELRINYGPEYRLYYTMREQVIVILLCGSDKSDQKRTIKKSTGTSEEGLMQGLAALEKGRL